MNIANSLQRRQTDLLLTSLPPGILNNILVLLKAKMGRSVKIRTSQMLRRMTFARVEARKKKNLLPRVLIKRTLCNGMKIILTDTFISDTALSYIRLFPTVPLKYRPVTSCQGNTAR